MRIGTEEGARSDQEDLVLQLDALWIEAAGRAALRNPLAGEAHGPRGRQDCHKRHGREIDSRINSLRRKVLAELLALDPARARLRSRRLVLAATPRGRGFGLTGYAIGRVTAMRLPTAPKKRVTREQSGSQQGEQGVHGWSRPMF